MSVARLARDRALAAERAGDLVSARQHMAAALETAPRDAALANSAGAAHLRWQDNEGAAALFGKARRLDPNKLDYAINFAIALGRLARHRSAARMLAEAQDIGRGETRYWSARGNAERQAGMLTEAENSYAAAIAHDPRHARAAHGRARVAFERGRTDAVELFDRALQVGTTEGEVWLGKAMALDAAGRSAEARTLVEELLRQAPGWIDALDLMAQLRVAACEPDFDSHYARAAATVDRPEAIIVAQIKALAAMDRFADAAEAASHAAATLPEGQRFRLYEGVFAGMAGDIDRAEAVFAEPPGDDRNWREHAARHDIRMGRVERAEAALEALASEDGDSVNLWALRDVCWRLMDDARHHWLSGQDGLVQTLTLDPATDLPEAARVLETLHGHASLPLGQSVRGGTQTRGTLFQRAEPELAVLAAALSGALDRYRSALPPHDPDQPLLRHRDAPWSIAHSWSVRLTGAGYHTSHIHPEGIVSSALYIVVPDTLDHEAREGYLEIGRPPPDLRTDLGPLATIRPEPGKLALFPSTLFHGTRPVVQGPRMSVAFDVLPQKQ